MLIDDLRAGAAPVDLLHAQLAALLAGLRDHGAAGARDAAWQDQVRGMLDRLQVAMCPDAEGAVPMRLDFETDARAFVRALLQLQRGGLRLVMKTPPQ